MDKDMRKNKQLTYIGSRWIDFLDQWNRFMFGGYDCGDFMILIEF